MPKTKGLIFPYAIKLRKDGKIETFPAAEAIFYSKEGDKISLLLIVDSGATISALPKEDAEVLGIKPENGIPFLISSIAGERINAWKHEITAYLGQEIIRLPIAFLDSSSTARVLGRAGIFNHFTIIFEEEKQRTGFIKKGTSLASNIQKILNKLQL